MSKLKSDGLRSSKDLKEAIELAINGDQDILFSIGKYITYNYYMNIHIKKDSEDDKENEKLYKQFEIDHPDLYKKVENWVDYNFKKFERDED